MLQLLLLSLLVSLTLSLPAIKPQSQQSIYDVLKSHGLPMGLLPQGVNHFTIDADSGWFEAYLDQACNAKFESQLHYDRNVSGTLTYGRIGSMSGISAQELFLWFPVKGIRVDVPSSGLIYFDVGVVFKQFSLSLFETPRECMAIRDGELFEDVDHGRLISDAIFKGRSGKLRYRGDVEKSGRVAVENV